jgi:hypothetical protein
MAECYRKQGNRPQAIASYQRVVKDFPDQTKLAAQSRTILATTYSVAPAGNQNDKAKFDKLMEGQNQEQAKTDAARARYRQTIEEEMALDEERLSTLRGSHAEGSSLGVELEEKIIHLKRDLAAFDAGMPSSTAR